MTWTFIPFATIIKCHSQILDIGLIKSGTYTFCVFRFKLKYKGRPAISFEVMCGLQTLNGYEVQRECIQREFGQRSVNLLLIIMLHISLVH